MRWFETGLNYLKLNFPKISLKNLDYKYHLRLDNVFKYHRQHIVKLLRFYDKMILKYFCSIDFTLIRTRLREDFCTMHHDIRCNSHRVYVEMGEKFHLPSARNFGRIKYKCDYLSYGSKQTLTWIWTLHWVFKCTMRHFLWQMCM